MNIIWQYLDKRSAAVNALKDYSSMAYILAHTDEEIAQVHEDTTTLGSPAFTNMPGGSPNPQSGVGLLHPAAAGHGLNLQAGGSHLIWFGLTWSLELYQQTNARLWRQGQQSETVVIQHLITKGTIDERILKALTQKEQTQTALMQAVKAELGGSR